MDALIFDCDGVLVDTERDGHRVAFNQAFSRQGLEVEWDEELYGELLQVGGGKERMRSYFSKAGWPTHVTDRDAFIQQLHASKTSMFLDLIQAGRLPLRPGVARIIDEAITAGVPIAVCSTSNERAVQGIVDVLLGEVRSQQIQVFAGDMAKRKKPDPEIYHLATSSMNLNPGQCMVVEDSRNGLLAAVRAGMRCLVTLSTYTGGEDFSEADLVIPSLDDFNGHALTLEDILTRLPAMP